jgi:hypothetical protein
MPGSLSKEGHGLFGIPTIETNHVDDAIETLLTDGAADRFQVVPVGDEPAHVAAEFNRQGAAVEQDDLHAAFQQFPRDGPADDSRSADDKDFHARSSR